MLQQNRTIRLVTTTNQNIGKYHNKNSELASRSTGKTRLTMTQLVLSFYDLVG